MTALPVVAKPTFGTAVSIVVMEVQTEEPEIDMVDWPARQEMVTACETVTVT